ncbi:MAG: tRNA1(Val) (adenine(37)-N6)-methyltransferase [Gudongella sp.]|nr:tRNA1(Val) (adenine(37)-N6)-methyltransferase [Gudongella sp.]
MEKIDIVPGTKYRIIQNKEMFSYGIDAILLSDFAKARGIVIDLGTGTGIIPLRLSDNEDIDKIFGIEIQKEVADMAQRNVDLNNLNDKIEIWNMDLKELPEKLEKGSIDTIITNPPYMKSGGAVINNRENFAISRHEIKTSLEDIVKTSSFLLKQLGKLYIVHRPNRLVDVLCSLRENGIEPKYIKWVYPKKDKPANLFLLEAIKGAKRDFKYRKPLIVYRDDGEYTDDLLQIYDRER